MAHLQEGAIVEARWLDGNWYLASILSTSLDSSGRKTVSVQYTEFEDIEHGIPLDRIRHDQLGVETLWSIRDRVYAPWIGDGLYYPSLVVKIDPLMVEFEGFDEPPQKVVKEEILSLAKGDQIMCKVEWDTKLYPAVILSPPDQEENVLVQIHTDDPAFQDPYPIATYLISPNYSDHSPPLQTPAIPLTKEEKEKQQRQRIVQEIVSTEKSYLLSLRVIVDRWMKPMEVMNVPAEGTGPDDPFSSESARKTLFSNIKTIRTLHEGLLTEMEQTLGIDPEGLEGHFAKLFIKFVPFFKMYQQYVNNYDNAILLLDTLLSDRRYAHFTEFAQALRAHPSSNDQDLESLLIMPVQRIPRYKLLIAEVLKHKPKDMNLPILQDAYEKISQVTMAINEHMRSTESRQAVLHLQNKFVNKVVLVSPSRKLVHQGRLRKLGRNNNSAKSHYFLFNDLLVRANKIGWKFMLHSKIPLDGAFGARNVSWDVLVPNYQNTGAFGELRIAVFSSTKSFILLPDNETDFQEWSNAFDKVIRHLKLSNSALQRDTLRQLPTILVFAKVLSWSIEDVALWLHFCDLQHLIELFREFQIDGKNLIGLTKEILREDMLMENEDAAEILITRIQKLVNERSKEILATPAGDQYLSQSYEDRLVLWGNSPRFVTIDSVDLSRRSDSSVPLEDLLVYNISIALKLDIGPKTVKVQKRYRDFELLEEKTRKVIYPGVAVKLPNRETFRIRMGKRSLLEKYIQTLSGSKETFFHFAPWLGVTEKELSETLAHEIRPVLPEVSTKIVQEIPKAVDQTPPPIPCRKKRPPLSKIPVRNESIAVKSVSPVLPPKRSSLNASPKRQPPPVPKRKNVPFAMRNTVDEVKQSTPPQSSSINRRSNSRPPLPALPTDKKPSPSYSETAPAPVPLMTRTSSIAEKIPSNPIESPKSSKFCESCGFKRIGNMSIKCQQCGAHFPL